VSAVQEQPSTVRELIEVASRWLAEQGVDEARLGTEHLLAHVLGCRRLDLYLDHDRRVPEAERARFRALMRRRAGREPLAYLLGTRGFYGLDLEVGPGVLVPRPETEHLVEGGLEELGRLAVVGVAAPRVADVGTGSGCVALALLAHCPGAVALGIDRSAAALAIAARNARATDLAARLRLVRGDLLSACAPASLDLVVSNPPYITPDEHGFLAPEVKDHEPPEALYDDHGLPLTAALAAQARRALRPGGALLVETGYEKAALVRGLLEREGFSELRTIPDLAGIERIVAGRVPA
jgi:release factor glutamine methyltransferase